MPLGLTRSSLSRADSEDKTSFPRCLREWYDSGRRGTLTVSWLPPSRRSAMAGWSNRVSHVVLPWGSSLLLHALVLLLLPWLAVVSIPSSHEAVQVDLISFLPGRSGGVIPLFPPTCSGRPHAATNHAGDLGCSINPVPIDSSGRGARSRGECRHSYCLRGGGGRRSRGVQVWLADRNWRRE